MGASAAFAEATASIMTKTVPTGARTLWRRKLEFMATTSISVAHRARSAKYPNPVNPALRRDPHLHAGDGHRLDLRHELRGDAGARLALGLSLGDYADGLLGNRPVHVLPLEKVAVMPRSVGGTLPL